MSYYDLICRVTGALRATAIIPHQPSFSAACMLPYLEETLFRPLHLYHLHNLSIGPDVHGCNMFRAMVRGYILLQG